MFDNVAAAFADSVRAHSENTAIVLTKHSVTYAELGREVARWASIIDEHFNDLETPIACQMKQGVSSVTALLAIWKSGRTAIPLPCDTARVELRKLIQHSTAGLILTDSAHLNLLSQVASPGQIVVNLEETPDDDQQFRKGSDEPTRTSQPAIVIYTSGSTGHPKGVIHWHSALLFNNQVHTESLNLTSKDSALLLATWNTISGITDILRMLLNGGSLIPVDLQDAGVSGITTAINKHQPTIVHFVPTIFRRVTKQSLEEEAFSPVRILHLGGEPVTRYDFDLFRKFFPLDCIMLNNFGCAEVPTFRQSLLHKNSTCTGTVVPLNRSNRSRVF